jgi:hypothetical protein
MISKDEWWYRGTLAVQAANEALQKGNVRHAADQYRAAAWCYRMAGSHEMADTMSEMARPVFNARDCDEPHEDQDVYVGEERRPLDQTQRLALS